MRQQLHVGAFYVVRNKQDHEAFASNDGWAPFKKSTLFTFTTEESFQQFVIELPKEVELVELSFTPVVTAALN